MAPAGALLGSVVFFRPVVPAPESRPALLGHEAGHAAQYAWCLGLPFLPLYGLAAAWSWLRTGDPASRNPFERAAGRHTLIAAPTVVEDEGLVRVANLTGAQRATEERQLVKGNAARPKAGDKSSQLKPLAQRRRQLDRAGELSLPD